MATTTLPPVDKPPVQGIGRPFGRFTLQQLLGRSQLTMAWLALDSQHNHEVMLLMPRAQPASAQALLEWQEKVQAASRLSHPHLAPVMESGVHNQWPYIAVDRALGLTLEEWLSAHPSAPADQVGWVCQALEGLAFAHESGVAHTSVEAYTLLIDEAGHVRWVGLGVGFRAVPSPDNESIKSTDFNLLHEQREAAAQDVLSMGVLLHRLLVGAFPWGLSDIASVLLRLPPSGSEHISLPRRTPHPLSDALRAISNRATTALPRQRYLSARTFLRALEGWRENETRGLGGPLNVLLDRINTAGLFPARTRLAQGNAALRLWEIQRTDEISMQVLQDIALALEVLRQANVPAMQGSGSGQVLTVGRSVAMIGIDGVRRGAQSLRAWPGALNAAAARALETLIERVKLSGVLAQYLAPAGYDLEVLYIINMLQNLGRLLVQYHYADEAEQIRNLMQPVSTHGPVEFSQGAWTEHTASFAVLGMDMHILGAAVVKHWGMGAEVQHMIHRLPPGLPVRMPEKDVDWIRTAVSAANEVVDMVSASTSAHGVVDLSAIAQRYSRVLDVDVKILQDALQQARELVRKGKVLARSFSSLASASPEDEQEHGLETALTSTEINPNVTNEKSNLRSRLRTKVNKEANSSQQNGES